MSGTSAVRNPAEAVTISAGRYFAMSASMPGARFRRRATAYSVRREIGTRTSAALIAASAPRPGHGSRSRARSRCKRTARRFVWCRNRSESADSVRRSAVDGCHGGNGTISTPVRLNSCTNPGSAANGERMTTVTPASSSAGRNRLRSRLATLWPEGTDRKTEPVDPESGADAQLDRRV